ncbi:WD repeat-containing protein YMR102C [Kluyveromyces marxianus]|uniref:WD repeat-containing protein YMR102C n=1 Tax=Kluyveromyces marxianus TaxID=4911 RepID=A0ABX6ETC3_KLUMA|nr:WD repeat-containing protein YMR102C [Kluyveromyces marxianus]
MSMGEYPDVWNEAESGSKIDWLELASDEAFKRHVKEGEHMKVYRKKKRGFKQFRRLILAQELCSSGEEGAVWCLRFSKDGKFMASAGKDEVLRVWKVISSPSERLEMNQRSISFLKSTTNAISELNGRLARYTVGDPGSGDSYSLNSNSSLQAESLGSASIRGAPSSKQQQQQQHQQQHPHLHQRSDGHAPIQNSAGVDGSYFGVFHPKPYASFHEHSDDILDVDWSKNSFIITGSMDKSCKLWHCERETSLHTFVHPDFVTGVRFFPLDDRFFVSACLDQKCRLWSILDKKVLFEYDCGDLITAMDISHDGRYTILGTFNGHIHVLVTKSLELLFSFNVLDKNSELNSHTDENGNSYDSNANGSHGHGSKFKRKLKNRRKLKQGPKITGLEFIRKEYRNSTIKNHDISSWFLVSSNDSRIRIYTLGKELLSIMKGHSNEHSQITAHSLVTRGGKAFVVSASEDHWIYCWKISDESSDKEELSSKDEKGRRSRSGSLRGFCKRRHNDHTPLDTLESRLAGKGHKNNQPNTNSNYIGFHAHHHPITCATMVPSQTSKVLSLSNDLICELTMQFWETTDDITAGDDSKRSNGTSSRAKRSGSFYRETIKNDSNGGSSRSTPQMTASSSLQHLNVDAYPGSGANGVNGGGNDNNAKNQPTLSEFVGSILVSADTTGVIRVFRSDISSNVRQKVLARLAAVEAQMRNSHIPMNATSVPMTKGGSHHGAPHPPGYGLISSNGNTSLNGNEGLGISKIPTNGMNGGGAAGSMGNGNGVASGVHRSNSMLNGIVYIERPTPFPAQGSPNIGREESMVSLSTLQQKSPRARVCNVCGGTNFAADQKAGFSKSPQNMRYFCLDCGALYTSFR